jgi:hypothetical protein
MIRLAFSAVSTLCLLAAAFLLLQSDAFPEQLPADAAGWVAAFFVLFRDPVTAAALLAGCAALAVVSACVTELLLGLIFSIVSGAVSLACLIGFLGSHYPPLAGYLERLFR